MSAADGVLSFSVMANSRPSWDFRRGTAGARILVELGVSHGLEADQCLAGTGLHVSDLHDSDVLVEAGQELAIARHLIARLGDRPGLGLEAGQRYTIGSLGVWAFALLTSPTVGELMRIGTHYAPLSFAFIRPQIVAHGDEARVVFADAEIPGDVRAFFVERELAKLATLAPVTMGDRAGVLRFATAFRGARLDAMRAAFPTAHVVADDAHYVAARLDHLDDRLPQADPTAARALERECSSLLDRRRRLSGVAARVRSELLARPHAFGDMRAIADALHMDDRTLRRHLANEDTSFKQISDEIRETLAAEMLTAGGLSVEQVAHRLGYHDAANFSRAFRRWTGTTPGTYRRGTTREPHVESATTRA
jgi:AraC-like DNA-binding protein